MKYELFIFRGNLSILLIKVKITSSANIFCSGYNKWKIFLSLSLQFRKLRFSTFVSCSKLLIRKGSEESLNNRKVAIHGGRRLRKVRFVSSPVFPPESQYFAGYASAFLTN